METESPHRDRGPSDRAVAVWLGLILVVAAAARLHALGTGLWFDEILTLVHDASKPFARIVTTYDSQNSHLLYSVLAAASVSAFGETAWALRLPAALFGVAGVAAVYAFGARIGGRLEALFAAAILAVSYHHVWFSQDARGYTALMFFVVVGSGAFLGLLGAGRGGESGEAVPSGQAVPSGEAGARRTRRAVLLYAVSMALAAYTHLTGLLVVASHGIVWAGAAFADRRRGRPVRRAPAVAVGLAALGATALYAPVLPGVIEAFLRPDPATQAVRATTRWTSPLWMIAETARGLARGAPGGVLALAAGAVVGAAGLVDHARRSPAVAAVLVLPSVLVVGVVLATGHNLWPRFLFFGAGFAVLIAVRGVVALAAAASPRRGRAIAAVALALAVVASAARVPAAWGPKQDYGSARAFVEARRSPGDAVVTLAMATLPWPEEPEGWTGLVTDDLDRLEAIERDHDRTWAIWAFPTWVEATQPRIWARMRSDYRRVAVFPGTVAEGAVVVAVRG